MQFCFRQPSRKKPAARSHDASHCLLGHEQLAEWILADGVPARLSLQRSKFIWDPAAKGV